MNLPIKRMRKLSEDQKKRNKFLNKIERECTRALERLHASYYFSGLTEIERQDLDYKLRTRLNELIRVL